MIHRPLIPAAELHCRVAALGAELSAGFIDREPVLLVLMDGAFVFAADLARHLSLPGVRLHFVTAKSYVGTSSSGQVHLDRLPDLAGHDVLVIDDILDTGRTLAKAVAAAQAAGARSVATCVLLDKPARRVAGGLQRAAYVGFTIDDHFVVGYGLDHDGRYRHLPDVSILEP